MKKCPYCAENIKDEAIVCRYCGRDLPRETKKSNHLSKEKNGPGVGISLLLGILLVVTIYGIGFLIAFTWKGNASDLQTSLELYQVGTMFVVTLLALSDQDPEKRGFLRFLGYFILSIIPLAGWVIIFKAGQCLARTMSRSQVLGLLFLLSGTVVVVATFIGIRTSGFSLNQATPTSTPTFIPTTTPIVLATPANWATQVAYGTPIEDISNCIHWQDINASYVGKLICTRGVIMEIYRPSSGNYLSDYSSRPLIYFSDKLYILTNQQFIYGKVGDCIIVFGKVSINNDVFVIYPGDNDGSVRQVLCY